MIKTAVALLLFLAATGSAAEPYRPLPRLSPGEVKKRAAGSPAPAPAAPDEGAPGAAPAPSPGAAPAPSPGPPPSAEARPKEPGASPRPEARERLAERGRAWRPPAPPVPPPAIHGRWMWGFHAFAPLPAFPGFPVYRFHGFRPRRYAFVPRLHLRLLRPVLPPPRPRAWLLP